MEYVTLNNGIKMPKFRIWCLSDSSGRYEEMCP